MCCPTDDKSESVEVEVGSIEPTTDSIHESKYDDSDDYFIKSIRELEEKIRNM